MKKLVIVQARMGSTRLPGKVLKNIQGRSLISLLLERLSEAKSVDQIILATTVNPKDDVLEKHVRDLGYEVYRGSENDVLDRYFQAAKNFNADIVVRITGDCPLVDPDVVNQVVFAMESGEYDYASNINPPSFPDGLDVEAFSYSILKEAASCAKKKFEREHVTPWMRENVSLKKNNICASSNESSRRWTVDEESDLKVVRAVFEYFHPQIHFGWEKVVKFSETKPEVFQMNGNIPYNEGASMGSGQKLWKRAKSVIPGGNMLLSKRSEMFLPEKWPSYFKKAKGCLVWDLDDKCYTDMLFAVGTNTLGYGCEEVDLAVREVVECGNLTSLNAPEEVLLAEKLLDLHPWAEMARFARSGGEANAIAIRIARAYSKKEKVAICGYHGWHDWYLSANLGDDQNLAGHLLPGLAPQGVPQQLKGTVLPFAYNNFAELESLVQKHDIGVIKMEVSRNFGPENDFLEKVREFATSKKIVLVFDECTSGFRETFGGLHKKYNVNPDMAMFGKALGNGYAITSVIGKREVMEAAQETFISSTFWTERIGSVAALKTLEIMEKRKSWETITNIGRDIKSRWSILAEQHGIPMQISGLDALCSFSFSGENALAYKTLITQEMLKKGFLASNIVYVSIVHTQDVLAKYFEALSEVFSVISKCENGAPVSDFLEGPICQSGFRRLN